VTLSEQSIVTKIYNGTVRQSKSFPNLRELAADGRRAHPAHDKEELFAREVAQ
jgi:hypothetical protein